jgi:prenyltransferase beta subunit
MKRLIYRSNIDQIIKSCIDVMSGCQRTIEGETGWHQHLDSKKVGIVATSIAILFFNSLKKECNLEEESYNFIVSKQKKDGGWSYISNLSDQSNTESTCWALRALNVKSNIYTKNIDSGVKWLLGQIDIKSPYDQGWGFISEKLPRVYNTCFVLRTLKELSKDNCEEFISALKWLESSRNENGGWGETKGSDSGVFFTAYAIVTLIECGHSRESRMIKDAIQWLEEKVEKIGLSTPSMICCMEFIEENGNGKKTRTSFFHFTIPYILEAFIKSGHSKHCVVYECVDQIISTNEDGYWRHPFLESSTIKPIWTISDSINSINLFKNSFDNWSRVNHFKFYNKKIRSVGKYSLVRHWDELSPKFIARASLILFLIALIYGVIKVYQEIPKDFMTDHPNWFNLGLSIIASLIASGVIFLSNSIYRKTNQLR